MHSPGRPSEVRYRGENVFTGLVPFCFTNCGGLSHLNNIWNCFAVECNYHWLSDDCVPLLHYV